MIWLGRLCAFAASTDFLNIDQNRYLNDSSFATAFAAMSDRKTTTCCSIPCLGLVVSATLPNLYPGSPRLRLWRLCSGRKTVCWGTFVQMPAISFLRLSSPLRTRVGHVHAFMSIFARPVGSRLFPTTSIVHRIMLAPPFTAPLWHLRSRECHCRSAATESFVVSIRLQSIFMDVGLVQ
jgi:hypothetical protein